MVARKLDWDSDLFGFPVSILDAPHATAEEIEPIIRSLREDGVRLVYWPIASGATETESVARSLGAIHVDDRTTYSIELVDVAVTDPRGREVEAWPPMEEHPFIEDLGVQSGEQSRFATDPHLDDTLVRRLYTTWMRNCLARRVAREVYVVRGVAGGKDPLGVVTVGVKNDRADIGLIAVDSSGRGRGLGRRLVAAALAWSRDEGFPVAQVVTQGRNLGARRLYESCGYELESIEPYYHLWLD